MNEPWKLRITIEPGKRGGRPCIRGMRISVYDVLSYLAAGMTSEQILDEFPYLQKEGFQACLSFAAERERNMSIAVSVRLLLDQNLSPRSVARLADAFSALPSFRSGHPCLTVT